MSELEAISSPEFSDFSVSGGSPGRTLGTRNFYRRNRAVPVLVRMLGLDETEVSTKSTSACFRFQPSSVQPLYDRERRHFCQAGLSCFWNWSWLSI